MPTAKKITKKKAAPKKKAATKKKAAPKKKAATKKKTTTKKKAAKKLEVKRDRVWTSSISAPDLGFDILGGNDDLLDNAAQVLSSVVGRRTNQSIGFASAADIRQNVLWIPEFELQNAMGVVGIPHGSFLEIIAPESTGKTSLAFNIAGWAMNAGAPVLYCECEGKQMPKHRIIRMLHADPKRASQMLENLRVESISSLDHLDKFIRDYVDVMRGRKTLKDYPASVPNSVPLVIIADPWSRLMNQEEAAMVYDYGDNMNSKKGKKLKDTAGGSNFGHAKFAHAWCRRMAYTLRKDNVIMVLCQHQTEDLKDAMAVSFGPKMILPQSISQLKNKNHIGGRALHQLASQQWVIFQRSAAKFSDKTIRGKYMNMCVVKNSLGAEDKKMFFEVRSNFRSDLAGTYLEPAVHFSESFAKWFAGAKYMGSKIDTSGDTYTCEDLGLRSVSAEEFHRVFHANKEARQMMGDKLNIEGYVDTIQRIRQDIEAKDEADRNREQQNPAPNAPPKISFQGPPEDDEQPSVEAPAQVEEEVTVKDEN